jgi:signal transduction histidine kinase
MNGLSLPTAEVFNGMVGFLICIFYFVLLKTHRTEKTAKTYVFLAITYGCQSFRRAFALLASSGVQFVGSVIDPLYIIWTFTFWMGVRAYGRKTTFNPIWLVVPVVLILWSLVARGFDISRLWRILPMYIMGGTFLFLASVHLWRLRREHRNWELTVLSILFLLSAVNTAIFPFVSLTWYGPYGYIFASVLNLAIGMGMMLIALLEEQEELVSEMKGRMLAEEALQRFNAELETKVAERTQELLAANIRMQELDHLKSMFIASMSHELRTPLNSIVGFTGVILMGFAGSLTEEQKTQLTMVKNSANHLLSLINDVIDVSKIETGKIKLEIEKFNLPDLLGEVRDSLQLTASRKGLSLLLKAPQTLPVESDRRRIRQVVVNLVGNAVKFTDRGDIRILASEKNGNAEIAVSDTGSGIREEDMQRLFNAFSRIHVDGRPIVEGTGLGLYLSRRIAVLLGGDIRVESTFGEGSVFIFTLPLIYKEKIL